MLGIAILAMLPIIHFWHYQTTYNNHVDYLNTEINAIGENFIENLCHKDIYAIDELDSRENQPYLCLYCPKMCCNECFNSAYYQLIESGMNVEHDNVVILTDISDPRSLKYLSNKCGEDFISIISTRNKRLNAVAQNYPLFFLYDPECRKANYIYKPSRKFSKRISSEYFKTLEQNF